MGSSVSPWLKAQIRQHWLFRFDWFIKSRTPKVGRCKLKPVESAMVSATWN